MREVKRHVDGADRAGHALADQRKEGRLRKGQRGGEDLARLADVMSMA